MNKPTLLERAYELARSGRFDSVSALRKGLRTEGYADSELYGNSLITELGRLCREAVTGEVRKPKMRIKPRLLSAAERSEAAKRGAAKRSAARAEVARSG